MNSKAEVLITNTTNETLTSPSDHSIGRQNLDASMNSITGEGRISGLKSIRLK